MDIAADVGEQKRPLAAHLFRIALHDFQACTDIRSQINLVGIITDQGLYTYYDSFQPKCYVWSALL